MKSTMLVAAILLFACASEAQYSEQKAPAPAPAANESGRSAGDHRHFDDDDYLTVPLEINPSDSAPAAAPAAAPAPATAYAHGDRNAPVPGIFLAPRSPAAASNISGQFQQLVQARNAANSGAQGQPQLQVQNLSLADLARKVREEKATEEKAKVKIKQDAHGNAILVQKPQ